MKEIIDIIINNLINVGIGAGIFVVAYLANVLLSLWYNIKMLHQEFDYHKLINSALKILSFGLGTALLVIGITLIPMFADYVGLTIPQEYIEVLQNLAIIAAFVVSACKYLFEAYTKFKAILFNDIIEK